MISKFTTAAMLASVVNSQITVETEAYNAAWGCAKCLKNSQVWVIPTADIRGQIASASATKGKCCTSKTDSTNCNSFLTSGALTSTNSAFQYTSGTNSLEVLMGQCEMNTAVCTAATGADKTASTANNFSYKNTGTNNKVQLKMSGTYKATLDQCSWVVKIECGAPGIIVDSDTNIDATKATVSFVEYSAEFNTLDSITLENDVWLPSGTKPAYYDMDAYGGTGPDFKMKQFADDGTEISNYFQNIPGDIILEQYSWTNQAYDKYETMSTRYTKRVKNAKSDYEDYLQETTCLYLCEYEPMVVPSAPNGDYHRQVYRGPLGRIGNVTVGYGKTSAGVFKTVASGSGRSFGTHGQDGKKLKDNGETQLEANQLGLRLRTNSGTKKSDDRCDDSYVMVTMIPLADQSGSDVLAVTVSSEKWKDSFENPNLSRPDRMTDQGVSVDDENYGSATGSTGMTRLIKMFTGIDLAALS